LEHVENPRCAEVFISYAQDEDGARALEIADQLEQVGATVWIAERSIAGAQNYALEIVGAIDACKVVVILCSGASMRSPHVPVEMELAFETGRPRLPLMLEGVEFTNEMRYWLAGANRIDVSGSVDDWLPKVLHALELLAVNVQAAGNDPSAEPTPINPETVALGREQMMEALGRPVSRSAPPSRPPQA